MNEKPVVKAVQQQSSQPPAAPATTAHPGIQVLKSIKPSARYAQAGGKFIGVAGGIAAFIYAISSANPNGGHFLSLTQDLIIGGSLIGGSLLGSGIGYVLGRLVEKMSSDQD